MLTKSDLNNIRTIVKDEIRVETNSIVKKEIAPVKSSLKRIEKKLDKLFNFLDRQYLAVRKDVREIQSLLGLRVSEF